MHEPFLRIPVESWKTEVLNALNANVPIRIITAGSIYWGIAGESSRKAVHTINSHIMNAETLP